MADYFEPSGYLPEELGIHPDAYTGGLYFEIHIGDVFHARYVVVEKLGLGGFSIVWLVYDIYKNRYFAMKVLATECYGSGHDLFELEVLKHLQENTPDHPGHMHSSELVDSFTIQTEIGTTVCLIFGVMADTLHGFLRTQTMSPLIMKRFVKQILLALDHAHKSGVIHTDIKSDNIMIQLDDESVIEERYMRSIAKSKPEPVGNTGPNFLHWPNDQFDFVRRKQGINYEAMRDIRPWEHRATGMGSYYLDGRPCEKDLLKLNVSLCDWGLASWTHKHLTENITTLKLRSPECLIGAPWDSKTDIWSLGVVIFETLSEFKTAFIAENHEMVHSYFTRESRNYMEQQHEEERRRRWREHREMPQADQPKQQFRESRTRYELGIHLNEIVTMLEPFSKSLLSRVRDKDMRQYLRSIFNEDGTVWGYDNLKYDSAPLEDYFNGMPEDDEKEDFLQFLWKMLRVDPDDRSSAEELLKEPWLQDVELDDGHNSPFTPSPTTNNSAQPDLDSLDSGNVVVDHMDTDAQATTPISPPIASLAQADTTMTDDSEEITPPPVLESFPSSPKKRKLSQDQGKSNGWRKKNSKRRSGGKP